MTTTLPETTPDTPEFAAPPEHIRTGVRPETLQAAFLDNLNFVVGRPLELATPEQRYRRSPSRCGTASCGAGSHK